MTNAVVPPAWAERLLRLLLAPADREIVSGDLLEAYRDEVHPSRDRRRADWWYIRQVAWFAWRGAWVWGALLAAAVVGRNALDFWLAPTTEFYVRSLVSTYTAVGIFASAGLMAAWRSHSVAAGTLIGALTGAFAAVIVEVASLGQLAVWHDPHTLAMIDASGGLSEVFSLPLIVIVPGTMCATIGALLGRGLAWSMRSRLSDYQR
jgi:hypothetical protein